LFTDYEAWFKPKRWIRNTDKYDKTKSPLVRVFFNNYFGAEWVLLYFKQYEKVKHTAYGYYINPQKVER
jgi:hypothetical protein